MESVMTSVNGCYGNERDAQPLATSFIHVAYELISRKKNLWNSRRPITTPAVFESAIEREHVGRIHVFSSIDRKERRAVLNGLQSEPRGWRPAHARFEIDQSQLARRVEIHYGTSWPRGPDPRVRSHR